MYRLLLLLPLFFSYSICSAQTWELGGFVGGSGYIGDLNPDKLYKVTDLAFSFQAKRNFNPYWGLKIGFMQAKVQANDANASNEQMRQRNLSFFSPVSELSLQLELNFFKYIASVSDKLYSPYVFLGGGYFFFNPQTNYQGTTYELPQYRTEGQSAQDIYKTNAASLIYGLGIKYNITGKFSLTGEIGYRTAYTDFLDDVSGNYANPAQLPNSTAVALSDRSANQIGVPGTQRGNGKPRDTYFFTGIGLTYTFVTRKCPEAL